MSSLVRTEQWGCHACGSGYGGGNPAPVKTFQSAATIQLSFRTDAWSGTRNWQQDKSTRLVRASFCSDSTTIAVMPGSFPMERDPTPPEP
jgi:hypothetical protein